MENYEVSTGCSVSGEIHLWRRKELSPFKTVKCASELALFTSSASVGDAGDDFIVAVVKPSQTSCSFSIAREPRGIHFANAKISRCAAPENITAVSSSEGLGSIVAAGSQSGRLYIWELTTGRLLVSFEAHFRAVRGIAFTPHVSPTSLITCGDDARCHLWTLTMDEDGGSLKPLRSFDGHTMPIVSIAVRSTVLITASSDRSMRTWNIPSGSVLLTCSLPAAASCLSMDESERFIAVGMVSGEVAICDAIEGNGSILTTINVRPATPISAVALSPLASEIVVAAVDGSVQIVNVLSGVGIAEYKRHDGKVVNIQVNPLAVAIDDEADFHSKSKDAVNRTTGTLLQRVHVKSFADYAPEKTAFGAQSRTTKATALRAIRKSMERRQESAVRSSSNGTEELGERVRTLDAECQKLKLECERLRASGNKLASMLLHDIERASRESLPSSE
uniref:WD repeat-containing protein 54 beta-propeller domain-containing protein n=1 Tax=Rhodosorus marinus TaxID=101924 RepID=A0A7S2ZXT2_9RHOD|mmetsp:Transcript_37028/g.147751  ORF Transcript_37028/g.147751 Transcript_37028/m.147751 type:complete len:448 (+) Transcript_37028:570-1913(+)